MDENELFAKALELAALKELEELEKAAAALPGTPIEIDVTGTPLIPGHPKVCLGSGDFPGFPLCCDECDYLAKCAEIWDKEQAEKEEKEENERKRILHQQSKGARLDR